MATELIVNASLPETRIALMENGEIQEILIERAQGKGIVGNIYKGRVTRVLPGMQAAFVDIGLEKAAFLYVDDVFVHSDIWKEDEAEETSEEAAEGTAGSSESEAVGTVEPSESNEGGEPVESREAGSAEPEFSDEEAERLEDEVHEALSQHPELLSEEEAEEEMAAHLADDEEEEEDGEEGEEDDEDDEDEEPVSMGEDDENPPKDTVAPGGSSDDDYSEPDDHAEGDVESGGEAQKTESAVAEGDRGERGGRRRRRGRRGGRNRRRGREENGRNAGDRNGGSGERSGSRSEEPTDSTSYPEPYHQQVSEEGDVESDRSELSAQIGRDSAPSDESNRPAGASVGPIRPASASTDSKKGGRPEFREPRNRDRRIKSKPSTRPSRMNVSIQDLLKEGQEVIVQIAKDPIATKGARLTCHISLPGRHLVCMPTIDHVGVSRRIEKDEERRRLREYVDRNRPKGLGFIVRTATSSGKTKAEARIKQDIDYLSALWSEIKSKANAVSAPALVYEDLNPILRAIRDWVNEDIDKIIVDSRYHYNDVQRFVRNFMPGIGSKIELYQGDIPIFDAYGISTELARGLERKVWLKSGGYLVVDQAEALVAIDVNTGRYVGKKSLEDTILKTNLEAVKEIAYQLRLRNCGGIIILDLIDMEREENKLRVYRALEEELKKDRARPQILKISELGLVEMTRKRTRDTMVRALCDSCTQCEGKGYIKSKLTVAYEIMRDIEREGIEADTTKLLVQAHPDVIDVLAIDERESLDALEKRYKKQIYLQAVHDLHPEQYELVGDKRTRSSRSEDALLERARELAQTSDRGRGRRRDRGRGRDRDRNKDGERKSGGRNDRDRGDRKRNDRDRNGRDRGGESPRGDRARIGTRIGGRSGESAPASSIADSSGSVGESTASTRTEDFATEEDRLAYLRAQAAQDAALAGGGDPAAGSSAGNENSSSPNREGRWGSRNGSGERRRRGRRGGRGRFGRGLRGGGGEGSAESGSPASASDSGGNSGEGSSEGGDSGSGASDSGGGGDHSNPPA